MEGILEENHVGSRDLRVSKRLPKTEVNLDQNVIFETFFEKPVADLRCRRKLIFACVCFVCLLAALMGVLSMRVTFLFKLTRVTSLCIL